MYLRIFVNLNRETQKKIIHKIKKFLFLTLCKNFDRLDFCITLCSMLHKINMYFLEQRRRLNTSFELNVCKVLRVHRILMIKQAPRMNVRRF